MPRPRTLMLTLTLTALATACASPAPPRTSPPAPQDGSVAAYTSGMTAMPGYFPLYWDEQGGRLLLETPDSSESFLYLTSLATGFGSNALGLDRGEIMEEAIGRFRRVGPKVLLELENPGFRSATPTSAPAGAMERSVEESFPTSVIGGFDVVAESDGRVLVDATAFFLDDAIDLTGQLRRQEQGSFRIDRDRSAIWLPRTKSFPENTEVEAALTLAGDAPGFELRRHTPDARSVTIRLHHSFVKLPDDDFEPRRFDPRVGVFGVGFYDFGRAFDVGYDTRYGARHRLEKENPGAAMSRPVEPIVYYMDPAIPEPYRTAFKEGGDWWNQVFRAAGYIDAFQIRDMPMDMDPMDARYHVIQWVHRTEEGSSIGPSFRDPRTGEIIKAAVRMDSWRSLANYNTYAGLAGVDGHWFEGSPPGITGEEYVISRRRQHSAHEIGHTLGFAHNFIAISYGHASVMDYPAPVVRVTDGRLDMSQAYAPGAGAYDTLVVRYAYADPPAGVSEDDFLDGLMAEAEQRGWQFITNPDAGNSNSYPAATWWVNGADPVAELDRMLDVRAHVMSRFDERAIDPGEPMHKLWQRFAPVYFHHRAAYEGAIKTIGGMEYRYGVRGDATPVTTLVGPERVEAALDVLERTLDPANLAVPERILRLMAPSAYGWTGGGVEWESAADPAFDQLGAARTLADEVFRGVLNPARAARVAAFHARDSRLPSMTAVVARLVDDAWERPAAGAGTEAALARVVRSVLIHALVDVVASGGHTPEARAAAEWGLRRALGQMGGAALADPDRPLAVGGGEDAAQRQHLAALIVRVLEREWDPGEQSRAERGPGWSRGG